MARTAKRTRAVLGIVAVAVTASLLVGCGPALGRPATKQAPASPRVFDASDPAVLDFDGTIYLFGSSNNRKVPVRQISSFSGTLAESQTQWARSPRDAMPTRPAWVDPAEWQIWAPSVIKLGERFVMYYAAKRAGATDETNDQCIGRAEALTPLGPYVPGSAPIYCGLPRESGSNWWGRGALDPEIIRGADRKLYLLVSLSRTRANIGALKLDSIGRVIGGVNATPTTLVSQSYPWHDGTVDSSLRSDAFLENPSMVYEPNTKTYLLFYSAGQWYTNRYVTGFARCSTPVGPCTADSRAPMLVNGNGRTGVGGLTAFATGDGVLRAAYASWTAGRENQSGSVGQYSRQVSWGVIAVTKTTDPAAQAVRIA